MSVDTSADSIARMRDVLIGSLSARVQPDGTTLDAAGFNAVIPGLDAMEAWALIKAIAAERDALRAQLATLQSAVAKAVDGRSEYQHGLAVRLEQMVAGYDAAASERDRLAAENALMRAALEEAERALEHYGTRDAGAMRMIRAALGDTRHD